MSGEDRLLELAGRYWAAKLRVAPVWATLIGVHDHDDRLEDLSAGADDRRAAELEAQRAEAEAVPVDELGRAAQVTRALLVDGIETELTDLRSGMAVLRSDPIVGPHADHLTTASELTYPTPEAAAMMLDRARSYEQLLDQAADRFAEGVARGWTPARSSVSRSLNIVDSYLAGSLDDDPFLAASGPDDWDGTDSWRAELLDIVRDDVRPAFARFAARLRAELEPHVRPDEQPGLCWLEGGDDLYRAQARVHTGLDLDPAEVHEIGLTEIDRLANEYGELGPTAVGTSDLAEIFSRIREDPQLRYRDADDMRGHATACIERAAAAMGDWFGRLPVAPCVVRDVPTALAADSPSAYYLDPLADGTRPGIYFLNTRDPEGTPRVEMAAVAFHEAIPGHHLQIAISVELDDVPDFQRHGGSSAFVEGWALYAERLADEMGLYLDPIDRLGMLAGDSWRAARLVLDTGIHALGWSRAQAVEFMRAHTPAAPGEVETEVDRYIGWPGQALGYKLGHLEIQRLRADAEQALGERFDIRQFHDTLLTSGSLTLPVLRAKVEHLITAAA